MGKLAINGGNPIRRELFPAYNTIGNEEKEAVMKVLDSGNLSQFIGGWHEDFFGGPTVKALEKAWTDTLNCKHAISVNSNTSGLYTSMSAINIQPGDEVIVSPYSMSASAIAPLVYGGIPVFTDIDPQTLCMSPKSIQAAITSKTKAIIIVHIMGHPADMDAIMAIAKQHNIKVIEDCAQAPMGKYKNQFLGTIGDLGIFSLNYHKHIHTGEGGIIVTNSDSLAFRAQMVRNHAENIVEPMQVKDASNMIGYNYRMTEMEAAIGIEQLKKLPRLVEERIKNVALFNDFFSSYDGISVQQTLTEGSTHSYYTYPMFFDAEHFGIHRTKFVEALKAELPSAKLRETAPLIGNGYVRPLYLAPIYQEQTHWAFKNTSRKYPIGTCPIVEKMHNDLLFTHEFMRPGMQMTDIQDVFNAFDKITNNIEELR